MNCEGRLVECAVIVCIGMPVPRRVGGFDCVRTIGTSRRSAECDSSNGSPTSDFGKRNDAWKLLIVTIRETNKAKLSRRNASLGSLDPSDSTKVLEACQYFVDYDRTTSDTIFATQG